MCIRDSREGEPCGFGVYIIPGIKKYSGYWEKGMMHGKGVEDWDNGDSYIGQYSYGKKNGEGIFTWLDGSKYSGEFSNDKKEGKGTLSLPNGKIKYKGDWKEDKYHGKGELLDEKTGAIFIGNFNDNKKFGEGIIRHPNGTQQTVYYSDGNQIYCKQRVCSVFENPQKKK
eukprot:TRINITY_DN7412_c0_g1_i1.p2 TRINITY_DN7412_c0_g1~~TRINITY_DN7412_c0_g1_i1.p2  ORF type:complete len:170 (+),score=34.31 TRINITY_DN7412_c0_g1_i1:158-667(+)